MEPKSHNEYSPGAELPQLEEVSEGSDAHEQTAAAPETRGGQQPVVSAGSPIIPTLVPQQDNTALSPAVPGSQGSMGTLTADDSDLIEKEWVLKAKAIVMHTKDDPRAQNIQMNGVKADYLKKRYNKDLKVTE